MSFLPVALNLEGKKILIIGGGRIALQKAKILSMYTDNISFLAKDFISEIKERFSSFEFINKAYEKKDLRKFDIIYVCTNDKILNKKITYEARKLNKLVNVCDAPYISDFISPAIYKREYMSIAVTSDGKDVKRSINLRNLIREQLQNVEF